ncbi:MAG TPA: hypothetical protein VFS43_19645 [Polyangiaceae bacterium]|nr:hypothetical protein [Polyangiaceae bacterium]
MRTHTIVSTSLLALAGLFVGCAEAEGGPDAEAVDGPVAEQSAAFTVAANMTWSGAAHDTIDLIPGTDSGSATDADPTSHEVYQVQVTPQPNTSNGSVTVVKAWAGASEASCPTRSLSVRVLRTTAAPGTLVPIYSEILETDVTSTFVTDGGEFPNPRCEAKASVPFASTTTKLRVMAQARTRTFFNGTPVYVNSAATVSAKGTSPAPHLTASLTVASDGAANAFVINTGNVTAPAVDADITYRYKFCPAPSSTFESPICELSGLSECRGSFCPPGGFSWPFGPVRKALTCTWTKDFPQVDINANGGVLNWVWHQAGVEAGCGLCDPDNANCIDVYSTVTAKSTTAPYSSMTAAYDFDRADEL